MKKRSSKTIGTSLLLLTFLFSCSTTIPEASSSVASEEPSRSLASEEPAPSEISSFESAESSQAQLTDPIWGDVQGKVGNTLRKDLESKTSAKRTRTTTYSDCLSIGAKAAAYPTPSSSTFIPFYHEAKDSEKTTVSNCNREHVWPNSRGTGKKGPGADPFVIRPTLSAENTSRANYFYGAGGASNKEWDPASCGYPSARGEAARVIFYTATAYWSSYGFELSNEPRDDTAKKTMGTLKSLLAWNEEYPVTPMEKQINDYLDGQGYGRNPFVDHPEYATSIWGGSSHA